jgi:hypothetical protein
MVRKHTTPATNDTTAYRGYLIRTHPITGLIWIEKDGFKIGYAPSIEAAKQTIDLLAN